MVQIILLCVLLLQIINAEEFDPTKFNYCPVKCDPKDPKETHTACKCEKMVGKRKLLLDDTTKFRTTMVELHNVYRNMLANGAEEKEHGFPKAANMHVLNYDLELEYTAYCYAKRIYEGHDKCRMKHDAENRAGQNIHASSIKLTPEDYPGFYNHTVGNWYKEIVNVTDTSIVDKFRKDDSVKKPDSKIGHFTQLVWANARLVGCAMVYIDENKENPKWRSVSLCNYQGPKSGGGSGNMKKAKMYIKGEPCSQCPDGEKCNTEYGGKWNGLCGKSESIPTRKPFVKDDVSNNKDNDNNGKGRTYRIRGNNFFVIGMVVTLVGVHFY